MDRAHSRSRHRALAVALATLLVPLVVGSVAAASPTVVVTRTVTGASASIRADVNRAPNQIASCTYVLDGHPAVSCGAAAANGKKDSRYTIALSNQAVGGHTITVSIRLTDNGRASGSASFTIAAPRVFARAWSNLDGVPGYQAGGTDVLISELVDTNQDNVLSIGDTVTTGRYPLTFAATTFGTFTDTSHTVTTINGILSDQVAVQDGSSRFYWSHVPNGRRSDQYLEYVVPNNTIATSFADGFSDDPSGGLCDQLWVSASSPSAPDTVVPTTSGCDTLVTDETFLDVSLNLP